MKVKRLRKRYQKLIRQHGSDVVVALTTGVITNVITDAIDRLRERREKRKDASTR